MTDTDKQTYTTMEVTVNVDIDDVLDACSTEEVLDRYSREEISEYLEGREEKVEYLEGRQQNAPYGAGLKESIENIVRTKTNMYPDKKTVMETMVEIINDLW